MNSELDSSETLVLVVDDSACERTLTGGMVKKAGCNVVFAENGRDALSRIAADEPAVVLTDLMMPELDGLELVKRVRESHPRIPVILMTGFGSEEIAAEALRAGAASYVPKKNLASELPDVLRDVLKTIQQQQDVALGTLLQRQESQFELGHEENGLARLVAHLQASLSRLEFGDEADLIRIGMALGEALNNAVDHGNLELDQALRQDTDGAYDEMRAQRRAESPYCDRRVYVTQCLTPTEAQFVIRDEGVGFDPNQLPDPTNPENLMKAGGRGLLLIRTFMDEVRFNSTGNEITMIKRRGA